MSAPHTFPRTAGAIVALGGGGFSDGCDPALDLYILAQARRARPSVAFVGTASGDSDAYLARFYAAFVGLECRPTHLPLFRRTPDLAAFLAAQDVVYVGGGNTRSLLGVWREWDLPRHLRAAWESGTVLAGISAGAICWFEQGVTDSVDGVLGPLDGLGFLAGSCCPHYDGEAERRPAYRRLVASGEIAPGIALDDGAAAHFAGGVLHCIVSARPEAAVYRVAAGTGGVEETRLDVTRLEDPE